MKTPFAEYVDRLREFIQASLPVRQEDASAAAAEASFNRLALRLFDLQYRFVAPYRSLCEARKVRPQGLSHWTQIPSAPTCAFKEYDLSSLPPDERTHVFLSSGTSGQRPGRHFHHAESLAIYEQSLVPWFSAHLPSRGGPARTALIALTPPADRAAHSSLVYMFETIRRAFPWGLCQFTGAIGADGTWDLNERASLAALTQAADAGAPVLLLGTAFSFVHLLDFLGENNLRFSLPEGSRAMETGGYKGRSRSMSKENLHASIATLLGIPRSRIVSEYGMSELSSQAYDQVADDHEPPLNAAPPPRPFLFPPWARVRILSPENGEPVVEGETGLIQVFDLANVRSVMAIQTEDLGLRRGAGFEWVGRAELAEPRGCSLMTI